MGNSQLRWIEEKESRQVREDTVVQHGSWEPAVYIVEVAPRAGWRPRLARLVSRGFAAVAAVHAPGRFRKGV